MSVFCPLRLALFNIEIRWIVSIDCTVALIPIHSPLQETVNCKWESNQKKKRSKCIFHHNHTNLLMRNTSKYL